MSRFSILENGLKIAWIYSRTDQIFHLGFACWHQLVAACLGSGPPRLQCSVVSHPDAAKSTPFSDSRLSPLQFAKSPSFGLPCFSPHPFSKTKYCTIPLISSGYNITLYANDRWLWSGQNECPNCFRFVSPPMVQQWNFHRDLSRLKKVVDKPPMQCLFSLMETQKLNGREMLFSKCHDFTESKTFSQKSRAEVPE